MPTHSCLTPLSVVFHSTTRQSNLKCYLKFRVPPIYVIVSHVEPYRKPFGNRDKLHQQAFHYQQHQQHILKILVN